MAKRHGTIKFMAEPTVESIKKGLKEATGEDDILGFENEEDEEEYLNRCFQDGTILQEGDFLILSEVK